MCTFIGAEYLIANALIALSKKGIKQITFSQLNDYGIQVKKTCIDEKVDVALLLSKDAVSSAIFNFSDYFSIIEGEEPIIEINKSSAVENLKERFIGYLPYEVVKILVEAAKKI